MSAVPSHEEEEEEEEEDNMRWSTRTSLSKPIHRHLNVRLVGFENKETFTLYYIQVTTESGELNSFYIAKRYSQFDEFRQALKRLGVKLPELPPKTGLFKRYDSAFLQVRAQALARFLRRIVATRRLVESDCAQHFFFSNLVSESALQGMEHNSTDMHESTPLMTPMDDGRWNLGFSAAEERTTCSAALVNAEDLQRGFDLEGLAFSDGDMIPESFSPPRPPSPSTTRRSSIGNSTPPWNPFGCGCGADEASGSSNNYPRTTSLSSLDTDEDTATAGNHEEKRTSAPAKLRIVILLVGSRGDVQPYVALAKGLEREGHVVRIAAHECFRDWISIDHGLDFMPIAGDPKELLAMVVENRMFSYTFVKDGMTTRRKWIYQVLLDCWAACITPKGAVTCPLPMHPVEDEHDKFGPGKAFSRLSTQEYRADLIIANPPSFAGWHIAEALGIPLIMTFPMPWTRTKAFPSPFTALGPNTSASVNWMSFGAVDRLIWLGMGDLVNKFRTEHLALPPIWTYSAKGHRYIHDYRVPWLYCWSAALLEKPTDWGDHIHVNGYMFLEDSDGQAWEPSQVLLQCFDHPARRVVFIGFGSIVVRNPSALSLCIEQVSRVLIQKYECHVVVQKGWAGVELDSSIQGLFQIGSAPHSWLFQRCAVVVHHGGAGTTATALRYGVPSVIVPFFGDQFFWAQTVKSRMLGDAEAYGSGFTVDRLVECIETCMFNKLIRQNCTRVAKQIHEENGVQCAIEVVHALVWSTRAFDHHDYMETWRKFPYYDLKEFVKRERYEHPKGLLRKLKSSFRGITKFQPTVGMGAGLEMRPPPHHHSSNSNNNLNPDFAFLPNLKTPPTTTALVVPQGHTKFSWTYSPLPTTVPQGHTAYSWNNNM